MINADKGEGKVEGTIQQILAEIGSLIYGIAENLIEKGATKAQAVEIIGVMYKSTMEIIDETLPEKKDG